jgi:hypothetical protein
MPSEVGIKRWLSVAACVGVLLPAAAAFPSAASANPGAAYVSPGTNSVAVSCVKYALNTILSAPAGLDPYNNYFDSKAVAALKRFQQWVHLPADGVVGKQTGSALWYWYDQVQMAARNYGAMWIYQQPLSNRNAWACYWQVPSVNDAI